ncbi:MMPL family transporter [Algoriphagus chordae]|uniref:Phospholipid/glycerol acyltransferase domain-containing protein n=1 Tax=Algoriphagus chordae TaxID=237019 RepID=A0A2W7QYD0_9BACT|nr:MMPL family transporter [Algoriphagus chordae]PZX48717.1 hypothetical protein LV85_03532 [Algoriphagus chordae]
MDNFFFNSYQWLKTHKFWGLLAFVACFVGLGFYVQNLKFEEDITKLIPVDKENAVYHKVLNTVNFADKIIINISKEGEASEDDLVETANLLTDSLTILQPEYIAQIQGKIDEESIDNTLDFVYEHLPIFLEAKDYETISQKLNKDSIDVLTQANYNALVSPSGIVSRETILRDPLGLTFLALKNLQQSGLNSDFILENGYLMSSDKQHILLFLSLATETNETKKNTLFVNELDRVIGHVNETFQGKVSVSAFGSTLVAVANANQIKRDVQFTVGIALFLLLLILIVFYRKLYIPIILFVPTLFGGLLAMAVLCLVRSEISAISLGIGSVLLGITLDYSLHILTHIRSNNNIKELYKEITQPILMSSLTTALAFLCLLFLSSQALQDLGLFAAISVLGASLFALIFIPQVYKKTVSTEPQQTILDRVAAYPFHKSKWLVALLLIFFGISIFTYDRVVFNKDISSLNFEPENLKQAEAKLDKLTNSQSKSIYLVAYGDTEEEALRKNDQVFQRLQGLKAEDKILRFNSVGGIVKSKAVQKEKIAQWNSFWSRSKKDSIADLLVESSQPLGFKPTTFQGFYEHLNTAFTAADPSGFSALKLIDNNDLISSKDGMSTVSNLIKIEHSKVSQLENAFEDLSNTVTIDRQQTSERFLGHLKKDFNHLMQYSLVVILVLLWLFYRSVSLTLVTAIPICLTWLLTIGIMGVLGLEFNIFNIIISTFIFGLGIDYSIFVTNGMLRHYQTGENVLRSYKVSIILSVITTILGMGVLIFAKHPALYSVSTISVIGILSAMITTFAIQPLLFKLLIGSHSKRPITLRYLIHSSVSFGYFGLVGLSLSIISVLVVPLIPVSGKKKMPIFHYLVSKFMKSVLYTNPLVSKKVLNPYQESFKNPVVIIANHSSFLDILAIGMLHPKIIFLVSDWVYHSPVFGKAVKLAGFYPVSDGLEKGMNHLKTKIDQGYSIAVFPEGTRSYTHQMRRFHKGAFLLAETFNLDILPVLIHGNSEVLPKGTFIIKDGSITIKLLERIKPDDARFGISYSEKTKGISKYFKAEFEAFRDELETESYFHPMVLEEFRYKGDAVFNTVKQDLKKNSANYFAILPYVGQSDRILHLTDSYGQLNNLLALDGPLRNITSLVLDESKMTIAEHTVTANGPYKLKYVNGLSDSAPDILILNFLDSNPLINSGLSLKQPLKMLILIHQGEFLDEVQQLRSNMKLVFGNETMQLYKKP